MSHMEIHIKRNKAIHRLRETDFSSLELPVHPEPVEGNERISLNRSHDLRETTGQASTSCRLHQDFVGQICGQAARMVFFVLLLLVSSGIWAMSVGSNTAPSRETFANFSPNSSPSTINAFAGMDYGFMIGTNLTTTVNFNSYFPVGNVMFLNGNTLSLGTDLYLASDLIIPSLGYINGNNHRIEFAPHDQTIMLPNPALQINLLNNQKPNTSSDWATAWSADNNYVAVGTVWSSTGYELFIYSFNGLTLMLTASIGNMANNVNDVAWQPATEPPYYLVAASDGGLFAYQFTPPSTLVLKSTGYTDANAAEAVAWHPSGNIVAACPYRDWIYIYSFNSATGALTKISTSPSVLPQYCIKGTLNFDYSGNYLACGCVAGANQLQVFSYNATTSSLTSVASASTGQNLYALAWSPDGTMIAVGGSANQIQVYSFNRSTNTLTLIPSYTVGDLPVLVESLNWSPDGTILAALLNSNYGCPFFLLKVNTSAQRLLGLAGYPMIYTPVSIRWSPNGTYLAVADNTGYINVFNLLANVVNTTPLTLTNANVVFNSPVQLQAPVSCGGACIIDGNGYTLNLNSQSLNVKSGGASLLFRNIMLEGITGTNLQCLDTLGTISFENVTCVVNNSLQFNQGQLAIIGECIMTGTGQFIYTSNQGSTIFHGAQWYFDRGMTFSYFPQNSAKNLISFADSTAQLYLYETALYIQSSGLQLTKGTLKIDGQCPFYSYATSSANGILIGDNANSANNVNVMILPESGIYEERGYVIDQNIGG